MSAIGSVMVMSSSNPSRRGSHQWAYGDAKHTMELPGGLRDTGQFALVRHVTDADAAQSELPVDRLRPTAPLAAGVCAHRELRLLGGLQLQRHLGHVSSPCSASGSTRELLERESEELEQRPTLVVGGGGSHDRDVHAADPVNPVLVDLVKHRLLGEPEGVVAVAVELAPVQAAEVADTRQRD